MSRYVSKPSHIEAVQWNGYNYVEEVLPFIGSSKALLVPSLLTDDDLVILAGKDGAQGFISVPVGHWIVRAEGDNTHYWPVDPDYFASKYAEA